MAIEKIIYESVPNAERDEGSIKIHPPSGIGVRHVQALLLFFCLSIAFAMRAHLGVTMESMTSDVMPHDLSTQCQTTLHNNSVNDSVRLNDTKVECQNLPVNLSMWNVYRTYEWNKSTHEMILFSFFVGYTSMMLPMGILAQKLGGKLPIMIALGANGLLSIVTPWLPIWFGWPALCICRLLQGMTQAAMFPSIHTLLARWSPLCERGRLSCFVYTGIQLGIILAFQLAGLLAGSPFFRWPATFWCLGLASLVCFCLWGWLGAASPHEYPSISNEELAFITQDGRVDEIPKKRKVPWKHIITSPPVWALITAQVGGSMGHLLILTQIPMYMNKVLGLDIKRNGLYSSLPFIAMYFTSLLFGFLADYATNKKLLSIINIRRTANIIGFVVSGILLLAFSYINDITFAVIILILSMATHSGVNVGYHINQIDLAPNFAGPIMALGNTLSNLSGLLISVLISSIVKDDVGNQNKWQIVFLTVVAIQIINNTVFVIFLKVNVQPWNFYGEEDYDENKIKENVKIAVENSKETKL